MLKKARDNALGSVRAMSNSASASTCRSPTTPPMS
jgi:hypothetical protein